MPICPAGSTVQPGKPSSIVVTTAFMQSLLPPLVNWLYPFLPYIRSLEIGSVGDFCSIDPPELTLPSADAFFALISGGKFGIALEAENFIHNVFRRYLWENLCMCVTGSPTFPSVPSAPADLPALNPPGVVTPPSSTPCAQFATTTAHTYSADPARAYVFGLPPQAACTGCPTGAPQPIPAGSTYYTFRATEPDWPGVAYGSDIVIQFWTATNASAGSGGFTHTGEGSVHVFNGSVPVNTVAFSVWITVPGTGVTANVDHPFVATVDFYCGGQGPGTLVSPCCPPDQIATGYLAQILDMVTLIQRQQTPFAYIVGTAHSGLTGAGELAVQGLIGARITITDALPGSIGVEAGDPEAVFGAGWINWGIAGAFMPRQFLSSTTTLSLPEAAGVFTTLSYSLPPGVVATIWELVREP